VTFTSTVRADYLVVGAGAVGMAFVDALVDHCDARVALVDRRHGVGGHWLDAYPFVRLHQASTFYGVASTLLGGNQLQTSGPEAGLRERATAPEICTYYGRVLQRLLASGRVQFFPNTEYLGDGRFVSRVSGRQYEVGSRCRIVDAHYLSPHIPVHTPPPFAVDEGTRVIPVNDLVRIDDAPPQYVVVGAGKTATDACIWLLTNGVDPDRICWVRPRDPWMLNRAKVQPDPTIFLSGVADILESAVAATTPDDMFLRMEDAGLALRIDRRITPTMAKAPTLATWELEHLRTIENVVRLGHVRRAAPGRLTLTDGDVAIAPDAVVVHCAAPGLQYPPLVPIWHERTITLQPVRAGFPQFGAALAGYVEATRSDDTEKNRLCPPTPYPDTTANWAFMHARGLQAGAIFNAEPDIKAWTDDIHLNPARIAPGTAVAGDLAAVIERFRAAVPPGLAALTRLAGGQPSGSNRPSG